MSDGDFEHDVCVIGLGRVGLPLALSVRALGRRVVGVERDAVARDAIAAGRMPFNEPGYEALAADPLEVHPTLDIASSARHLIVTVGTPLRANIEADMRDVNAVFDALVPQLRAGHSIILRSTVSPRTTEMVGRRLARATGLAIGAELALSCCPERTAEGRAREELATLPQIVGADDEHSAAAARALFEPLTPAVFVTSTVNAELLKLFTNIERYVHFAVANHFTLVADTLGGNIHEIRRLANDRYPREHIASPGFTGGACLRKDFGMIDEWSPYLGLSTAAWRVNESMPMFLVQHLRQRTPIVDRRVAVLGYSFKAGSDDARDSLTPKLIRYIERECPTSIAVNDPFLPDPIGEGPSGAPLQNLPLDECLAGADIVFVAVSHPPYADALRRLARAGSRAWVADLWNSAGNDQLFYSLDTLEEP